MMTEGPWTRIGAIAGMLALILTYVGLAAANHWFPFPSPKPPTQSSPGRANPPTQSSPVQANSPAPGVSTSSAPGKVYLSTLEPVESIYTSVVAGPVNFSATTYQDSIRFTCEGGQSSVIYNVAGFKYLDATIDVPDDAKNAAGNIATIKFLKNDTTTLLGQPIADIIGQKKPIHLDLQGAAQLDIACTAVASTSGSYESMDVALGNAAIGPS